MTRTGDETKLGRIVWHEIHTSDMRGARAFYAELAGWHFAEEKADTFAWSDGPGTYVLALDGEEAGAGIVMRPDIDTAFWLAYVEVEDADAAAARAAAAGGTIETPPFDVPGVGRNAVIRDPHGARIGVATSTHDFPRPTRQFGTDRYVRADREVPVDFYRSVFGWEAARDGRAFTTPAADPEVVAMIEETILRPDAGPCWLPALRIRSDHPLALMRVDPAGAPFIQERR